MAPPGITLLLLLRRPRHYRALGRFAHARQRLRNRPRIPPAPRGHSLAHPRPPPRGHSRFRSLSPLAAGILPRPLLPFSTQPRPPPRPLRLAVSHLPARPRRRRLHVRGHPRTLAPRGRPRHRHARLRKGPGAQLRAPPLLPLGRIPRPPKQA